MSLKNVYAETSNNTWVVYSITLLLSLTMGGLLSTCNHADRVTTEVAKPKPLLTASPNPVPAGDLDKPLGTTTITWNTGDGTPGNLYVKIDREPEKLVARASSGKHKVRWIQFDSVYEFRLYAKKRSKLLATLTVTRDD